MNAGPNQTKADAQKRVGDVRLASLVDATEEYLGELEYQLRVWIEHIDQARAEQARRRAATEGR